MNSLLDVINNVLIRAKRSQRVRLRNSGEPVKVNFGSSLFVQEGWINVEGSLHALAAKWPSCFQRMLYNWSSAREWFGSVEQYLGVLRNNRFVYHNLSYGLPFPDGSVDYVYGSHILEHFYSDVGERLLQDIYRVLRKGGRVRICVPDLNFAIGLYLRGEKERSLAYFFKDSKAREFYRHNYMYDFEILEDALRKAGFSCVEKKAYRQGDVPDIERLDNRPDETLYVEALK